MQRKHRIFALSASSAVKWHLLAEVLFNWTALQIQS